VRTIGLLAVGGCSPSKSPSVVPPSPSGASNLAVREAYGHWSALAPLPYGLQTLTAIGLGDTLLIPGGGPVAGPSQQSAGLLELG
jgi:hypothetical protein